MKFIVDAQLPRRLCRELVSAVPHKLLLISTGNISNDALAALIFANLAALEIAFQKYRFVELNISTMTIHL